MSLGRLCRLLKPALLCGALAVPGLAGTMCASQDDWRSARSMYEFSAKDIDGHMVNLDKYRGFLVDLHARYAECGLRILAFPCNQFGKQEPGSNQEIKEFAAGYNVKFDMFSKICVNGDDAHPLWKWMKNQPKGKGILGNAIKWNFTKFLIDKNGCVVKRYGPMEEPQAAALTQFSPTGNREGPALLFLAPQVCGPVQAPALALGAFHWHP
ncbi:Phospholipid hydroperoxide glutathione peroxidase, mitochondrial [Saguinus oedipus]|uniref:phospholipid-hydroperoxide glutathione peroxidase n=1 Tax=Saguinus oedipus TaxID=9490 RepID=A0ABQ9TQN5_SAGOE|nr:Phospholipid hydroperoxide glutathione peroxidase, mitochondrial [Saguinus oedipus]